MREHESQGDLGPGRAVLRSQFVEHQANCGDPFVGRIVADDSTASKGTPSQRSEPMFHRLVEHSIIDRAELGNGKLGLHSVQRNAVGEMGREGPRLRRRVVRNAEETNLARSDESSQRRRRFGRMSQKVWSMNLVQIDDVGPHAPKRVFACRSDMAGAGVVGNSEPRPPLQLDAAFGGEHHAFSETRRGRKHLAEEFLGGAPRAPIVEAVHIGGVDQRHTGVDRGTDPGLGGGQVGAAKSPASEGDRANLQAGVSE